MYNYDPKKQVVSIGGNIATGFAEDSFVEVTPDEDDFTFQPSADGAHPTRSQNRNGSVTIRVRLKASSPTNDVLSAMNTADRLQGTGVFPFAVTDLGGRTALLVPECWIQRRPDLSRGKEAGDFEWTLRGVEAFGTIGGGGALV